ncbi:MAG: hypothetical protein HY261_01305 [Chloroflexi bacterium]|nr:hypothetical protein [Chloroflexota bacterium]
MQTTKIEQQDNARPRTSPLRWAHRQLREFWAFSRRKPLGGISAVIILIMVVMGLFANFIAPNPPLKVRKAGLRGTHFAIGRRGLSWHGLGRGHNARADIGLLRRHVGSHHPAVRGWRDGFPGPHSGADDRDPDG